MRSNPNQTQHDIKGLLAELEAAEQEFNNSLAVMESAIDFLHYQKGRLNEHQYVAKLEAVSHEPVLAAEVVANQHCLRSPYLTGRLALTCSISRLSRGLQGHDKLVRTIMKMVATIPKVENAFDRNLLGSQCLVVAQRSKQAYEQAMERYRKESEKDPTAGQSRESLKLAYDRMCAGELGGQESDSRRPLESRVCFIPLDRADLREYGFKGTVINDHVAKVGTEAVKLLTGEQHKQNWDRYQRSKAELNEPQYVQRLQQALGEGNQEAVKEIKQQQKQKRIDFLSQRMLVGEYYQQLRELAVRISNSIPELKGYIAEDQQNCPTQKLVAMSNVVAADVVCRLIGQLCDTWDAELRNTEESRELAQKSLHEVLGELVDQHPYAGLRWSCYGPGSYTEPL